MYKPMTTVTGRIDPVVRKGGENNACVCYDWASNQLFYMHIKPAAITGAIPPPITVNMGLYTTYSK